MSNERDVLILWRDSVAAGDDADAPHEWRLAVPVDATVDDVARRIAGGRWLASIVTGEATWIVEGRRALAVIAQQWPEPRLLVDARRPVRDVARPSGDPHLKVRYWVQANPGRVFEALRDGRPLPDRTAK